MGDSKRLIIIGASGHGKVVADIAINSGYQDIAFLDDADEATECAGFPVVGKVSDAASLSDDADFIVAIGNAGVRKTIQNEISDAVTTLVHPAAVIGAGVKIGKGSVVMAGAVINPYARIGEGCIVNTCASVDHDCVVGDYVHISVGAHLAGNVHVGSGTWVGIGATVSNNVAICPDCMIGAGAVVVRDITEPGTYVGIPAKKLEKSLGG